MKIVKSIVLASAMAVMAVSCITKTESANTESGNTPAYTEFNADSCYRYLTQQTDMGARVLGSEAHKEFRRYLCDYLKNLDFLTVTVQNANFTVYNGFSIDGANIIASVYPERKNRIIVAAHYDSRPWCDEERDPDAASEPVLGANDGASGVAVMLELIRSVEWDSVNAGVDFLFLDAEDYGVSDVEDSFCLGSQYWSKNPHTPGYKARFGILLDMVGAPDATFYRDMVSDHYAKDVVDMVWKEAHKLGYNSIFINQQGGYITDDHYYINKIAGIPCIDIIDYEPGKGFPHNWHTTDDTPLHISTKTLEAVGIVVGNIIYKL